MKHPVIERQQTHRLIADIRRVVDILNVDIAEEERLAGISDPKLPEYPMVARTLAGRRDNLERTLASLESAWAR